MQQSLKMLREAGWTAEITEHWNSFGGVKVDFANFADIIFFKAGHGRHACQVTTRGEIRPHIKKILAEPRALIWILSGGRILLHGWNHKAPPGKKRKIWTCKGIEITERHFKK